MKIREFKLKDYKEVSSLLKKLKMYHKDLDNKKVFSKIHKTDPDLFLVAEEDKKVVGMVLGLGNGRIGFIFRLLVDVKYQGRGIGKTLVKDMEKRLKKRGCVGISLMTLPKRKIAIKLYKKLGYKRLKNPYIMGKRKL